MLRPASAILLLLTFVLPPSGVLGEEWGGIQTAPSESECRPYIEKALKELGTAEGQEDTEIASDGERQSEIELNEPIEQVCEQDSTKIEEAKSIEVDSTESAGETTNDKETDQPERHEGFNDESDNEEKHIISEGEPNVDDSEEKFESKELVNEESSEGTDLHEGHREDLIEGEETVSEDRPTEDLHLKENETSNMSEESGEKEKENVDESAEKNPVFVEVASSETENSKEEEETQRDSEVSDETSMEHEGKSDTKPEESSEIEQEDSVENEGEERTGEVNEETSEALEDVTKEVHEETSEAVEDATKEVSEEISEITGEEITEEIHEENLETIDTVEAVPEESAEVVHEESVEVVQEDSAEAVHEESVEVSQEDVSETAEETLEQHIEEESTEESDKKEQQTEESEEEEHIEAPESEMKDAKILNEEDNIKDEIHVESVDERSSQIEESIENIASKEEESISLEKSEEVKADIEDDVKAQNDQVSIEETEEVTESGGDDIKEQIKPDEEREGQEPVQEEPSPEEEDLSMIIEIPQKLRPRDHISEILRLGLDSAEIELLLSKAVDATLRELKRLYETAIKPLEILYKYRDLSNRHFGDPEIFSKPLILFMGPWSGGKSTIINYLLDNEYKKTALRTGAEPSPAYFNIVMWGDREEVLDGTQLAADWTFSGLQKFGQGLLDRLRGLKLNHPLLEKVNIVEIPGILEIRKQVERLFPFNDACQWFIDRADIIFLVYDPAKLDVGPESEAILDQLKGREYQTRIILNKADQVRPEELMRVQGTLIWNISPLMSSTEPPVMYSTSLWSIPYESGAPTRLLYAQEKAFLRDLRDAIDKRVENKISSARRFAVRVRNHAKMVDCYLTTYYNHKSFFGNRKKVSDDIIEHPQNYHIYEGLSTLTNISRYDLPDPEVYKDFFRLNPVYDFQQLSATCTYFRGCPINRLDVAIAYDLPELVGKYKKSAEEVLKTVKKNENS